jgi:hypothetical protein
VRPTRSIVAILALVLAAFCIGRADAIELFAGGFSFSDELGGFRLMSASGSGTASDPVVLAEEFLELAPVTLVIRRRAALTDRDPLASLSLTKLVTNRSGQAWGGFVVELQEKLGHPSDYWDGLSFDQFGPRPADVSSDSFKKNNREFEPYDRIRFEAGHVDVGRTARFALTITDPTPTPIFYLVQDPQLLSAGLSGPGRIWAGGTPAETLSRGGG